MIPCTSCGSEFEQTPNQIRKKERVCLGCRSRRTKLWRTARRDSGNPVKENSMTPEYHQAYQKEYKKLPRVRRVLIERFNTRMEDTLEREKQDARYAVRNAIRRGDLVKAPCEVCGDSNSTGHHPNYDKPLGVIWLCRKHHAAIHAKPEATNDTQS